MKFGVFMTNWGTNAHEPEKYEEMALKAENLGYDSFFISDHFLGPKDIGGLLPEKHNSTLESWTTLANLAAKTSDIKLGTCVTPLPMRYPPILTKVITTLDILSEGRVIFGVGAGHDEREFEAYGVNSWESAGKRVERTEETLSIMKKMWEEEKANFEGKYYKFEELTLEPKSVQNPHPPVLSGAMGSKMLDMTARMGDYWAPSKQLGADLEFYKENAKKLKKESNKYDRDIKLGLFGMVSEKSSDTEVPHLGTFKDIKKRIEDYNELGCEYLILSFIPLEKYSDLMEKFKLEIAPSFQ